MDDKTVFISNNSIEHFFAYLILDSVMQNTFENVIICRDKVTTPFFVGFYDVDIYVIATERTIRLVLLLIIQLDWTLLLT